MSLPVLALLVQVNPKFVPAPGHETSRDVPDGASASAIWEGAYESLNSGVMTLLVLPILAVVLYRMGYRVAGPMLGLFVLGLFLARVFGTPA